MATKAASGGASDQRMTTDQLLSIYNSKSKLSGYIRAIDSLKALNLKKFIETKKTDYDFPGKGLRCPCRCCFFLRSFHWNWKFFCSIPKDLSRGLLTNQRLLHGWAPNHYPHNVEVAYIRRVAYGTALQSNNRCKYKLRLRLLYFYNKLLTNNISIIHLKICWLFLFVVVVVRRTYALKLQLKQFNTFNTCFSV